MNQFSRSIALWLALGLMFLLLFNMFSRQQVKEPEEIFSDFLNQVEKGQVSKVTIQGSTIHVVVNGEHYKTYAPADPDLVKTLRAKNIQIEAKPSEGDPWWMVLLVQWFPMLLLVGVWIFFMRQMQIGGGKAMSFGKSRAKLLTENTHKVTFADVAGIDEAKDELEEIIQFLKDPKRFTRLGGRIPKGVLLVGPPGTGKTLLARAIAGEAGVPFFSISGSDFVEMFVGVGASRVRDLFVQGKKHAPCIIFIDEIDAVGRHRGAGLGGGHDEREQTLNQLLVEMDGFEANEGVILVAATNRPDVLDPALLRPGRFDRRVVVPRPDFRGREGILKVHTRKVPLSDDVDIGKVARSTPGFAGADLENLVNEAALLAARRNKEKVEMTDFELAKDKVLMGAERRSMVMSLHERRNTAYHESGHALVAMLQPGADPVHKVTIIPRGMALGCDAATAARRSLYVFARLPDDSARDDVRRQGRGGAGIQPDHHRRGRRYREGDRAGAQDGLPVGHERGTGTDDLRAARGAGVPGPRHRASQGLLRAHRDRDRPRGAPHGRRGLPAGAQASVRQPAAAACGLRSLARKGSARRR